MPIGKPVKLDKWQVRHLIRQYQDTDIPASIVADQFGMHQGTMNNLLKRLGVPLRRPRKKV